MISRFLLTCVIALVCVRCGFADTLEVPNEYVTIQAAIDAAVDGDEVLVAPGTYNERIDYLGKAITVRSSAGPEVTTIDGEGVGLGAAVTFEIRKGSNPGDTPAATLEGFQVASAPDAGVAIHGGSFAVRDCEITENGGGVYITLATVTIDNCRIISNLSLVGGGVQCEDTVLTMTDCFVEGNMTNEDFAQGGGLYLIDCEATLDGCSIFGNQLMGCFNQGGGIYASGGKLTMTNCDVSNHNVFGGACGGTTGAAGGAMFLDDCAVVISASRFIENVVTPYKPAKFAFEEGGGAIYVSGGSLIAQQSAFTRNQAHAGHKSFGGAIKIDGGACEFNACSFDRNEALGWMDGPGPAGHGGAIWFMDATLDIADCSFTRNNTVAGNQEGAGGAIFEVLPPNLSGATGRQILIAGTYFCSNDPDHIDAAWLDGGGNVFLEDCIDGDLDFDGDVDFDDFTQLLANWGDPGCNGATPCNADIDGDGDVDFDDFTLLLANWS